MSSRRNTNEPEPTGEIHLRQTVQMTVADQTRTFEISVTLPAGASTDEIDRTIRQAEVGMRGLSEQMDRHISAARENGAGQMVEAAPHPAPLLNEPAPPPGPLPIEDGEGESGKNGNKNGTALTFQAFLAEAGELGYTSVTAAKALGITSFKDLDYAQALAQLRSLHAAPASPAPPAPAAAAPRAFAEEIGPYDAVSDADELAEMDEPDFGALSDEHGAFADEPEPEAASGPHDTAPPPTANVPSPLSVKDGEGPGVGPSPEQQRQEAAMQRLRQLRGLRGGGAVATPEQRAALTNCFINPLGNETAKEVISTVWHMVPGEKLNAPRTRALVEWGKEDDDLADTAARVIALAQQPTPAGE
jgi:hypothetical protein